MSTATCGSNPCSLYPVTVGGLSGTIAQVAGGQTHSLAVRSDGTAWAWGANGSGQLGNGSSGTDSTSPVEVVGQGGTGNLLTVTAVAGGLSFSAALKSDGSVWAWGDNTYGELGMGTHDANPHSTPTQVEGVGGSGYLGGVSGIAAGASHVVAVQGTGGVFAWGLGTSGQLGNNASMNKATPVQVVGVGNNGTLGGQTLIAAGADHSLALATTRTITTTYGYDRLYRLTSGGTPGTPNTYTYDPNGNRLTLTQGNATSTQYRYDSANRLTSVNSQAYTVDADGNLTRDSSGNAFTYDQANRLIKAIVGTTTTTYAYDGDGKRASKAVGSSATSYAYDANRALPVVLTDSTLKYVWGNGLAYDTDYSGNIEDVYHTDGLGSVRSITNASGAVTQTYSTDEFGVASLVQGTSPQPFGFTGEQTDAEWGTGARLPCRTSRCPTRRPGTPLRREPGTAVPRRSRR